MNARLGAIGNRGHDVSAAKLFLEHRNIHHLATVNQPVRKDLQFRQKITSVVNYSGNFVTSDFFRSAYRGPSHSVSMSFRVRNHKLSIFPQAFASDRVGFGRMRFPAACKASEEISGTGRWPNLLDRVERVAQFVVRPRLVDEILAGMAGRSDVSSAFAARHNVVPSRGHLPVTKCANFVHTVGPIFLQKHIHSCRWLKVFEPLVGLFHQLTPAPLN